MAHYDCDDCGASMGIAYGHCTKCTPPKVLALKEKLKKAVRDAEDEWDDKHEGERDKYAGEATKELEKEYQKEYKKYGPERKKK